MSPVDSVDNAYDVSVIVLGPSTLILTPILQ